MEPKVSVIIPVYNVEPWLRQCLDSVANQTLQEIEIICVDDGSSDNSGTILDEYALHDSRFKIIHKKNAGPVSARKAGLIASKAIYISYVDSDDWIEPEMLNSNYTAAIQTDADVLVNRGIFNEDRGNSFISKSTISAGIYQNSDLVSKVHSKMMRTDHGSVGIRGSLWAKLFKRCLIEKYGALVDERITISEDATCTYICIAHAKVVRVTEDAYYHYRRNRTSSITKSRRDDYLLNLHLVYNALKNGFLSADDSELLLNELAYFMSTAIFRSAKYLFDGYRCSYGHLFPFQTITKGCCLLLYGAGEVGIAYYRQLITTKYCSKVIWVDLNWKALAADGLPVDNPEELVKYDFDAAVIAILEEGRAQKIRSYLLEKSVPYEKIIWWNPAIATI